MKRNQLNKYVSIKTIRVFLLWLVIPFFSFCSGANKEIDTELPYLEIFYFKGAIETFSSIGCDKDFLEERNIDNKGIKTISRQEFSEMLEAIDNLNIIDTENVNNCNMRIQCNILLRNGLKKRLCIGTFNCMVLDNHRVTNNDSLIYLIRKYSGYYDYFNREELMFFNEIKTFGIPDNYQYMADKSEGNNIPSNHVRIILQPDNPL